MTIIGTAEIKGQVFASAVKWAAKFVTAKPIIPAHGGVMLDIDGATMHVISYSENVSTRAAVPVGGDAHGKAVVSGRLLAELAGTFPDKVVNLTADGDSVTLSAGRFRVTLPTLAEDEYPSPAATLPAFGTVDGQGFADTIRRVAVAASRDIANRVALAGIHLTFADGAVTALATDSYRVVRSTAPFRNDGEHGTALVLAQILVDVAEAFIGPDAIEIGLNEHALSLTSPTRSIVIRQLGEKFDAPAFGKWFGTTMPQTVRVEVADMTGPLKRAALVRAKEGPVRITFGPDLISMAAVADDIKQDSDEEIEADYTGPQHTMAFNPKYFAEALNTAPGKTVEIGFDDTSTKPAFFTVPGDESWEHILVPIRLPR